MAINKPRFIFKNENYTMVQLWVNFRVLKNNHNFNYTEPIQSLQVKDIFNQSFSKLQYD